jgi:predicted peptidase
MIAEGKVDEKRVYVTGLSMGGGGTIMSLSVGAGLFAAAVPICPTMTPDTYAVLCGLTKQKLWVAAAFIDHTIYRHKYLVDAILKLRDEGNKSAKLTLFSPEELEAYGLGVEEGLSYEKKFEQYHNCAILVYHNEHGIMDWMMDQVKD